MKTPLEYARQRTAFQLMLRDVARTILHTHPNTRFARFARVGDTTVFTATHVVDRDTSTRYTGNATIHTEHATDDLCVHTQRPGIPLTHPVTRDDNVLWLDVPLANTRRIDLPPVDVTTTPTDDTSVEAQISRVVATRGEWEAWQADIADFSLLTVFNPSHGSRLPVTDDLYPLVSTYARGAA